MYQRFDATCLIATTYNMCLDISYKKKNDNLKIDRNRLIAMAYPRVIKGKDKEIMLNTCPAYCAKFARNLNEELERKNYQLFEDSVDTKFDVIDPKKNHKHRSIPTIDLNTGKFFKYIYGIHSEKSPKDTGFGHAVNILAVEDEKVIIFDPLYNIIKRKSIDIKRVEDLKYNDFSGVYEISRNLLEDWWNTAEDRRWVWTLESKDAEQQTLNLYDNEEAKDYGLRKAERGI